MEIGWGSRHVHVTFPGAEAGAEVPRPAEAATYPSGTVTATVVTALSAGSSTQGQNVRASNGSASEEMEEPLEGAVQKERAPPESGVPPQRTTSVVRSSAPSAGARGIRRTSAAAEKDVTTAPSRSTERTVIASSRSSRTSERRLRSDERRIVAFPSSATTAGSRSNARS